MSFSQDPLSISLPEMSSDDNHDYSTGDVRRHHAFYFEEADICIQVEKAIFKVHRFFLAQRSVVLRDMFQTPQANEARDGTDDTPLVLNGDSAAGWEGLFQSIYSPSFLKSEEAIAGNTMILVLRLAHKYCMEQIEEEILSHFKKPTNKEGFLHLIACSQITGSNALYDQAIAGLVRCRTDISLEEARRIGLEAVHKIMVAPDPFWSDLLSPGYLGESYQSSQDLQLAMLRVRGRGRGRNSRGRWG